MNQTQTGVQSSNLVICTQVRLSHKLHGNKPILVAVGEEELPEFSHKLDSELHELCNELRIGGTKRSHISAEYLYDIVEASPDNLVPADVAAIVAEIEREIIEDRQKPANERALTC